MYFKKLILVLPCAFAILAQTAHAGDPYSKQCPTATCQGQGGNQLSLTGQTGGEAILFTMPDGRIRESLERGFINKLPKISATAKALQAGGWKVVQIGNVGIGGSPKNASAQVSGAQFGIYSGGRWTGDLAEDLTDLARNQCNSENSGPTALPTKTITLSRKTPVGAWFGYETFNVGDRNNEYITAHINLNIQVKCVNPRAVMGAIVTGIGERGAECRALKTEADALDAALASNAQVRAGTERKTAAEATVARLRAELVAAERAVTATTTQLTGIVNGQSAACRRKTDVMRTKSCANIPNCAP